LNECVEAEAWFREKKQQQDALSKYANPVLLSADVRKKAEALDRYCCLLIFPFLFLDNGGVSTVYLLPSTSKGIGYLGTPRLGQMRSNHLVLLPPVGFCHNL